MDKFGHHINKRLRITDFLETSDKAFILEEIDVQSKRLTGVLIPLKANDAVNKEYVDKQFESFASKQEVYDLLSTLKLDTQKYIHQFMKKTSAPTKSNVDKISTLLPKK